MAADVAGYSRLMHDNEEGTHARLTALLAEIAQPAIAERGGRVVKQTGDGFWPSSRARSRRFGLPCIFRTMFANLQLMMPKTGA